jgi:hypothetical protein
MLHSGRIENSFPVFVGPAGGADADFRCSFHEGGESRSLQVSTGNWQERRNGNPVICGVLIVD